MTHPASFRRILRDQTAARPASPSSIGSTPRTIRSRSVSEWELAPTSEPVDIAFLGIGENTHVAFNYSPADFETAAPYLVVNLDEACRRQQVGEGWFAQLADVPLTAVTMSVRQILTAKELLVIVPDARKAAAVKAALEADVSPAVPASILRTHDNVTLMLDEAAASQVSASTRARYGF